MEIFLIFNLIFILIICFGVLYLIKKFLLLNKTNNDKTNYIKFATNKINQARYGNFQIKLPENNIDELGLYKSLNNLFESIYDRDLVINEYREKEKENYNLKEEFIAALTHDLKVPVIAQDKTCNLLIENKFGPLTETQKEVIIKLKESNKELMDMINSILETYKFEDVGLELNIEHNVNVISFIKETIESLKNMSSYYKKEINIHTNLNYLEADFDKNLIKRIIGNLILNAISHSHSTEKIDVHLNKTGDTFSIDVIDYGDGIDEEDIRKIFNKYYSIAKKKGNISTGLGLYFANKIVKLHKGTIEVESKKGEGSIFRVILPIKNSQN